MVGVAVVERLLAEVAVAAAVAVAVADELVVVTGEEDTVVEVENVAAEVVISVSTASSAARDASASRRSCHSG
ncbi:hypothetical protein [Rhodococcus sp. ARC_M6]|uniref:hypothetical protein n=1 Tax=Rhodococcus sp. ARC_M6 TaxID=2928852 RepID=UPI001FB39D15|nr:hypothetical protein [Rhodococcus sp. ARC_M6]MCJ0907029.1 hypothetical protein [Rhodococcus sp. ARC_M6]